jgi:acetolactate synthase I/II/III large subunit
MSYSGEGLREGTPVATNDAWDEREASPESRQVRLVDWMMEALADHGIDRAFMVAGGGAMYLNDAVGLHPAIETVCMLHEQAAAIAAEAYTKVSGKLALCLVTSGPGGTNALTGVAGGWLDSTPMLVISGQAKRADLVGSTRVRQRGVQELGMTSLVQSITRSAVLVDEPEMIRYHLERALHLATTGRPGPVWIEVPLDVQGAAVDPELLKAFNPDEIQDTEALHGQPLDALTASVAEELAKSHRPLILVGAGVRLSRAEKELLALVDMLEIPVLTTWPAMGTVGDEHPLYVGRPGPLAARGVNFALQNADFLLCLGARLDLVTTGYDPKDFGRHARKVVVDIDPFELAKLEGAIDVPICADVGEFITSLSGNVTLHDTDALQPWRERCHNWKYAYPIVTPEHATPGEYVSTYHLADVISELIEDDDVLAPCSSGLAIEIFLLALRLRTGHHATFTTALGAMGYGVPAAIGACLGSGCRRTICIEGDGGLQINVQELETIRRLDLPIKVLVLSNDGYASIRASQSRWFGRLVGADASSGVTVPPLEKLAAAYGLPFARIDGHRPLAPQIQAILDTKGPILCEIPSPPDEPRGPVQISEALPDGGMRSRAIEDLAPLLDREELAANLRAEGPPRGRGAMNAVTPTDEAEQGKDVE